MVQSRLAWFSGPGPVYMTPVGNGNINWGDGTTRKYATYTIANAELLAVFIQCISFL